MREFFAEIKEEERLAQFKKFLGEYAVQTKHTMHLKQDMHFTPESEITIDDLTKQGK